MAKIDGGEMLIRCLERQGIKEIFTLHGGHLDAIYQACLRHEFRVIDCRHEQAAGHMADGWARTTGKPGVCVVTAGPGLTDAVTAIANAYMDSIPAIFIGGRSPLLDDDKLPLQAVDQMGIVRPITKWARSVVHPQRIPEYVAAAYRHAVTGRPGPVFLELPIDVLFTRVDEELIEWPQTYRADAPPAGSPDAIAKALDWLAGAERPAILAGGGVWFAQAAPELRQFAELTQIPVFMNGKARGSVPEDHPLGFGSFFPIHPRAHGDRPADVIMLLGTRIGMFTGGRNSVIPPQAKVIQVDIEGEEIGRNRDVQLGIVGDVREVLRQLIAAAPARRFVAREEWLAALRTVRERGSRQALEAQPATPGPIHPARLARAIADYLPADAVVVADGGEAAAWMAGAWRARHPGRFLSHGYLGCLGVGLPFGIAAQLAHPDKKVLVVTGDGSAGLNLAEFHTAVRHRLPIVVVVFNDQAWGMSKHGQEILFGKERLVATELGLVHYEQAAAGLGAHGELVERVEDIGPALDRAFASGRAACLNVLIDPDAVEPGTIAMYGGAPKPRKDAEGPSGGDTALPYYGRRKLDK